MDQGEESIPAYEKEGFQSGAADVPLAPGLVKSWTGRDKQEWTCSKCFAKNFKNRTECHKCGNIKSVAVLTRKTSTAQPAKL